MRYGIIEHHEDGDDSPHPYFVVDSRQPTIEQGVLGPKFTDAEASIIAWALTQIALGKTLLSLPTVFPQQYLDGSMANGAVWYQGPTAGVR